MGIIVTVRNSLPRAGLFFLFLTMAFPQFAFAAGPLPPLNFKGMYDFGFTGMRFGKLGIEIEQTPQHYQMTCDIASTGIVSVFAKHNSHSMVEGNGADFSYPDRVYETNYQTKNKKRHVKLVHKSGALTEEVVEPTENAQKRPPVPEEMKKNASDPLTFIMRMRDGVREAMQNHSDSFKVNVFDGRRLTEADFTVTGKSTLSFGGKQQPVIVVGVKRKQLAGFTKSEQDDANPNEPALTVYFTDDDRLVPLRMEVPFMFGKLYAALTKECGEKESCLLSQ